MTEHGMVPDGVTIRTTPRPPVDDPTLGVRVDVDRSGTPPNRLVTIGDSLAQGFMSAAVFRTDRSWPALLAHELALRPQVDHRFPVYEPEDGPGGLPLDLERAIRSLETIVGERLDWHELVRAARWLRRYMDGVEDYWERRDGTARPSSDSPPYHNLAVYGADLVDVQVISGAIVDERLADTPDDDLIFQLVEHANDRAWRVVLDSLGSPRSTVLDAARSLGEQGEATDANGDHVPGIETLVVMLGANNALGSVVDLEPRWTPDDYLDESDLRRRLDVKGRYNIWQPAHFVDEWHRLIAQIRSIEARHVIFATVPQVTIAPIARGVGTKVRPGSRYFPYYTRPWIDDDDFDVDHDPWIDEHHARAIDSAIDSFNDTIIASVRDARSDPDDPRDWYLFDLGALLDKLAVERYVSDPATRPSWWQPYDLPPEIAGLEPPVDTRFFESGPGGRVRGGWFSLDGVHPTTIGAGIVAREIARIMDRSAGVEFPDGRGGRRPQGTVDVDFERVIRLDTLISDPPASVESIISLLAWFDERIDWVRRISPF